MRLPIAALSVALALPLFAQDTSPQPLSPEDKVALYELREEADELGDRHKALADSIQRAIDQFIADFRSRNPQLRRADEQLTALAEQIQQVQIKLAGLERSLAAKYDARGHTLGKKLEWQVEQAGSAPPQPPQTPDPPAEN